MEFTEKRERFRLNSFGQPCVILTYDEMDEINGYIRFLEGEIGRVRAQLASEKCEQSRQHLNNVIDIANSVLPTKELGVEIPHLEKIDLMDPEEIVQKLES